MAVMQLSGQRREAPEGSSAGPTLKVAAVARRLGVAPATLRTWARRYGIGPPAHTAGAHRQYTQEDLSRLLVMRRLTLEGVAPAEAARIALSTPVEGEPRPVDDHRLSAVRNVVPHEPLVPGAFDAQDDDTRDHDTRDHDSRDDDARDGSAAQSAAARLQNTPSPAGDSAGGRSAHPVPAAVPAQHFSGRRGGTGWPPARHPSVSGAASTRRWGPVRSADVDILDVFTDVADLPADVRQLLQAAGSASALDCRRQVRQHVANRGILETWEAVVVPVLETLEEHLATSGNGWEVQRIFAESVSAVLQALLLEADEPRWGTALLACAEDEQHALPVHALAAALADRRVETVVLGAAVPHEALAAATARVQPKVVLVYSMRPVPVVELEGLHVLEERTRLLVAGPGWHGQAVPDGAVHAPSLAAAVDQVRLAVRH